MSTYHLPSDSFTSRRLEHATAEHLGATTARLFVGPIPDGWLKSHRTKWFRKYVPRAYNKTPGFRAVAAVKSDPASVSSHDEPQVSSRIRDREVSQDLRSRPYETQSPILSASASALAPSTASLIQRQSSNTDRSAPTSPHRVIEGENNVAQTIHLELPPPADRDDITSRSSVPRVRFSEPTKLQLRARARRLAAKGDIRSSKVKEGELLKTERMLVRIDVAKQNIGSEYDEKISLRVETTSLGKWREYMIVCRKHTEEGANAVLGLYKTRVVAASSSGPDKVRSRPKASISMSPDRVHVNLFSSLDKTLCLWVTDKSSTTIYYLRPQSGASSVEWHTFLRGVLGLKRPQTLNVHVPDLNVNLRLDDPFTSVVAAELLERAADGDEDALVKAVNDERGAAGSIVTRCIEMLEKAPEWQDILQSWKQHSRVGLAWRRYDRIEWIHGAAEQKMYGTVAMQRSHNLELRPKHHYPSECKTPKGKKLKEPLPIEGFLIRLTSQTGQERRMRRMMFKRLYFTTQNQFLLFVRPAKAVPPHPSKLTVAADGSVPSTRELTDQLPANFKVEPYPISRGYVTWLDPSRVISFEEQKLQDDAAAAEHERNAKMLLATDGFIDLCDVKRIRKMHKGAAPVDDECTDGSDVDFEYHESDNHPSSSAEDGSTTEIDGARILELVMNNDLVIRLQAYDRAARDLWIVRLKALRKYWRHRTQADVSLLKRVREQNLKTLQIDERAEATVGSYAYKWEVGASYASPTLYNMCGIAQCRIIHFAGSLFRKPRRHATFSKCHAILSAGHLLIYQDTLRSHTGRQVPQIYHERVSSIDLNGCYLYSGVLTEKDLLYQNRTFDSNAPGNHALPRVYLHDQWTSTDEDTMTTFVIWHATSKSWFRSSHTVDDVRLQEYDEERMRRKGRSTKLTRVSQLGATGRSVVFKARSRAERDHWVMAIQTEIERIVVQASEHAADDVRIV